MRTLKLVVDGYKIKYDDSNSDFSRSKAEMGKPLKIEVIFPPEWDRAVKVMAFYDRDHKECKPQVIENNSCMVPKEALKEYVFYVQILGKKNGKILETDKKSIRQIGG